MKSRLVNGFRITWNNPISTSVQIYLGEYLIGTVSKGSGFELNKERPKRTKIDLADLWEVVEQCNLINDRHFKNLIDFAITTKTDTIPAPQTGD
jgi:hypothetical protein